MSRRLSIGLRPELLPRGFAKGAESANDTKIPELSAAIDARFRAEQ